MKLQVIYIHDDASTRHLPDVTVTMKQLSREASMEKEIAYEDFIIDMLRHPAVEDVLDPIDPDEQETLQ